MHDNIAAYNGVALIHHKVKICLFFLTGAHALREGRP